MNVTRASLRRLSAVSFVLLCSAPLAAQDGDQGVRAELKSRVEQARSSGVVITGAGPLHLSELTLEVYERNDFAPLWTEPSALASLLRGMEAASADGLDPELYRLSSLVASHGALPDVVRRAELDLLATDAFVRLSHDLRFGRVEPDGPASGNDAPWAFGGPGASQEVVRVVSTGEVHEALARLRPSHFVYGGLVSALAELRRLEAEGGWDVVPAGPQLARDSVGARVVALRRRLRLAGDLGEEADPASSRYDAQLETAVVSFQHRHGLNADGIVGEATLAALNVPVERRIDQVRVNLERARWVAHELPETFVVVNVAGARVYVLRDDEVAFETRVIVGTHYTKTPVFAASMQYVELNPSWTVPPGIVDEVLAAARRDPGYLVSQGMHLLDASGIGVDPAQLDFASITAADFPFVIRQDPGPANALGRIKLIFPNEHHVYLHDTPTKGLFASEERLFSHGCVRVEDPIGLAEVVLGDTIAWNRGTLEAAIATGQSRTIDLAQPMPTLLLYWTAAVDTRGSLHFYRDVYGRDPGVLEALDSRRADGTPGEGPR